MLSAWRRSGKGNAGPNRCSGLDASIQPAVPVSHARSKAPNCQRWQIHRQKRSSQGSSSRNNASHAPSYRETPLCLLSSSLRILSAFNRFRSYSRAMAKSFAMMELAGLASAVQPAIQLFNATHVFKQQTHLVKGRHPFSNEFWKCALEHRHW